MKLSLVNQPWTIAAPPEGSDSTGIWSYQVSRRLVKYCQITYYGCKSKLNPSQESDSNLSSDKIEYRGISHRLDSLLKIPRAIAKRLNTSSLLPYFASTWFHYGYGRQVARDAAQRGSDIIHIHNHSQFVPIVRKYNPNAKIVLHLHCEWVNRLSQEAIAKRLAKLDLIISCSDYITNKIATRFPEYAGICRTVNNGVDADYFVPAATRPQNSQDAPQMLFVGRISPEKGVHDLIDAFIEVTATYPDAVLTIIGPHIIVAKEMLFDLQHEPEVQALEPYYGVNYLEYIKSKIPPHLSDQIIFAGSLPQEQVLPYYQQADVVINPSLSEAFGMSLVEAMATQTPVVATKIGGMTEIVNDGVTGLLSDPGDIQALANAITAIISEPETARKMGEAGRERVLQYYTWEQIAKSLVFNYATMGVNIKADDSKKEVARSLSPAN
ncbi:glycosyltransferase family 4 protein [Pleurocapsa sp. FMAR1]|uniref:glycosyltransferase family 4 protein n=1 Tax=Pleurocapsa sp. FMAR1 TaxID=3040204 RepID=UPI0029C97B90|nr:glycosyltransferase family 4 protein [Pleurocapsa sp. FMAR1]